MKIGDSVIYKRSSEYHPQGLRSHVGETGIIVGFAPYTDYPFVAIGGGKYLIDPRYLEDIEEAFTDFARDYLEHFNSIPVEFEFGNIVLDANECWEMATRLNLTDGIITPARLRKHPHAVGRGGGAD